MVQWLRLHLPLQGLWVQSLVGELRYHMPQGEAENIKNFKRRILSQTCSKTKILMILFEPLNAAILETRSYSNILQWYESIASFFCLDFKLGFGH